MGLLSPNSILQCLAQRSCNPKTLKQRLALGAVSVTNMERWLQKATPSVSRVAVAQEARHCSKSKCVASPFFLNISIWSRLNFDCSDARTETDFPENGNLRNGFARSRRGRSIAFLFIFFEAISIFFSMIHGRRKRYDCPADFHVWITLLIAKLGSGSKRF